MAPEKENRPTFSLSRVARARVPSRPSVKKETVEDVELDELFQCQQTQQKHGGRKPKGTNKNKQPSEDEEELLAKLLNDSDDEDKAYRRKRRRSIPIPRFTPTPESSDEKSDDDDLLGVPVFSSKPVHAPLLVAVEQEFRLAPSGITANQVFAALKKRLGRSLTVMDRKQARAKLTELTSTQKSTAAAASKQHIVTTDPKDSDSSKPKYDNDSMVAQKSPGDPNTISKNDASEIRGKSAVPCGPEKKDDVSTAKTANITAANQTTEPSVEEPLSTEPAILARAVQHAFDVVAKHEKLDWKQVHAALEQHTPHWISLVSKPKLHQHVLQILGPPQSVVLEKLNEVFSQKVNDATTTLKQVICLVQEHFTIPFSKTTRRAMKERLAVLMNTDHAKPVQSRTVSEPSTTSTAQPPPPAAATITKPSSKVVPRKVAVDKKPAKQQEVKVKQQSSKPAADVAKPVEILSGGEEEAQLLETGYFTNEQKTKKVPKRQQRRAPTSKDLSVPKPRGRKRRTTCQLCLNCPCGMSTTDSGVPMANLLDLAQSDAEIEKSLIKRLIKMEKTCDHYENQTDVVRRTLKRHRRDMWKKRGGDEMDPGVVKGRPRFLPDVQQMDQQCSKTGKRIPQDQVRAAQKALFDVVPAPTVQPTLTQMFGDARKEEEKSNPSNGNIPLETIAEEDEGADNVAPMDMDGKTEAVDSENVDDEVEALLPSEPVGFTRVECQNGTEMNESTESRSLWTSMLTGNYESSWETIFADACDDDDDSVMDDLIGIMEDEASSGSVEPISQGSRVELSMLSQRGQDVAQRVLQHASNDPDRLAALNKSCPNWRENVLYTLKQRDGVDLSDAVEKVRNTKAKLEAAKAAMLAAFERKTAVLNVFEHALEESKGRLEDFQAQDAAGFIPSQVTAIGSPNRRDTLLASDIKTLAPADYDPGSPMSLASRDSIAVN